MGGGNVGFSREGFSSLDAGPEGGTLTTRKLSFTGRRLFVNIAAPRGELRAEVLDAEGRPIAPFAKDQCIPIRADSTIRAVRGKDAEDLAGTPVRFRFHLKQGELYAFRVSPNASGASRGFVAIGGPGLTGPRDTVGLEGYRR